MEKLTKLIKLLTKKQKIRDENIKRMKRNKNIIEYDSNVEKYFNEISEYQPLSRKEEYDLWHKYKYDNDIDARNKLVSANLKFVANIAKNYQGRGLSYSDLISEGNVGLIRALDNFDGDKGFKVISYSIWWIRQAITEAIEKRNVMDAEDLPKYNEKDEIDNNEEIDCKMVNPIIYENDYEREQDIRTKIGSLMNFLSNKEKDIITQYYGLNGCKPKTLDEIGKELGISKERIRQINTNSFKKMRSAALSFNFNETIYNND